MALQTYSDLVESLSSWLSGSDLGGRGADFIALTEDEIAAVLAGALDRGAVIAPMITRDTFTISAEYEDLPDATMILPITLEVTDYSEPWQIEYLDQDSALRLKVDIDNRYDTSLPPAYYTIVGQQFRFFPAPSQAWTVDFTRYNALPALSDSVTSNWLLAAHRNVYLYGALAQAELFGWNDGRVTSFAVLFQNACEGMIARYPVPATNAKLRTEAEFIGKRRYLGYETFMAGNF